MVTFTATAESTHTPPRVRLDFNTGDSSVFTALEVRRDGKLLRAQPPVGSGVSVLYDYDAPFGSLSTWAVSGSVLPLVTADWTENWTALTAWTQSPAGLWSVSGGKARATNPNATMTRAASGTIQRVDVTAMVMARLELLDASSAVVASVQIDASKVTLTTSTGSVQAAGGGTFSLVLAQGTATATGSGSAWTLSKPFTGTPTKVKFAALGGSASQSATWSTTGKSFAVAVDSSGNVFVADYDNSLVRKYNSSGTQTASWSTTGKPTGIGVDSSGNVYVADSTNKLVRKFNSAGTQTASWSTTGTPMGLALDSTANVYVTDYTNSLVRKFTSAGAAGSPASWSTTGQARGITVDSSGNVFVVDDTSHLVRKYNSSGTQTLTYGTVGTTYAVAVDSSGNLYTADFDNGLIRKFDSTGNAIGSWPTDQPMGLAVDSSANVFVTNNLGTLRKYAQISTEVGQVVEYGPGVVQTYADQASATLSPSDPWLIHPINPDLSLQLSHSNATTQLYVTVDSAQEVTYDEQRTLFAPLGRSRQVPVTYGNRRPGDWSLVLFAPTIALRDAVLSTLTDQSPLLLRKPSTSPWDMPDDWYSVGQVTDERFNDSETGTRRTLTLPLTPVDQPVLTQGAQWTYSDGLIANPTYADSQIAYPTYLDRLVGS